MNTGYAIDLKASCEEHADGTFTISIDISGLRSLAMAQKISDWTRKIIREHSSELGTLMSPDRH